MPSMMEMVEAHLLNVQNELQKFNEQKVQIDQQIAKLETYLREGAAELQQAKATVPAQAEPQPTVFTPDLATGARP